MQLRIALLYLGKGGGISHCTYELAQALSGSVDVTCYLATQNDMLDAFKALPCRIKTFELQRGWRSLACALLTGDQAAAIAKDIAMDAPDVVIDTGSAGWGIVVLKQLRGSMPLAGIIHDVHRHPGLAALIDAIPEMLFSCPADIVISLSHFSHLDMVRKYPRKKHIESLHGMIMSSSTVDPESIATRRSKLLFFGNITPCKGLGTLVEAYAIAKQSNPNLSLDIVGKGHIKGALISRIKKLGIGLVNRAISDAEVMQVVNDHGIMVLPYSSATQSGVAAVAMSNGMPCVATNVGALPEQVVDKQNGLIVPPRDPAAMALALLKISSSFDDAKRMSEEALRIACEKYSWQIIGKKLQTDLAGILNGASQG